MYIYRALSLKQKEDALLNRAIVAKDPYSKTTVEDHVEAGRHSTSFISCTRELAIAKYYAIAGKDALRRSPSVVIKINTDRLPLGTVFDISSGKNPEKRGQRFHARACCFATRDKEVLVKGQIPKDAYEIVHITEKEWLSFESPRPLVFTSSESFRPSSPSTSSGASGFR